MPVRQGQKKIDARTTRADCPRENFAGAHALEYLRTQGASVMLVTRGLNVFRGGIRAALRGALSQDRRNELKRLQGLARKRLAPVLLLVHGRFSSDELRAELVRRPPTNFEILMVLSLQV
jgi:hypothetical protein